MRVTTGEIATKSWGYELSSSPNTEVMSPLAETQTSIDNNCLTFRITKALSP